MQSWLRNILALFGILVVVLVILHVFVVLAPVLLFIILVWFFVRWFRKRQTEQKAKQSKNYIDVEYRVKK